MEVEWRRDLGEIVVIKHLGVDVLDAIVLIAQLETVNRVLGARVGEEFHQGFALANALPRVGHAAHVISHYAARNVTRVAPRITIVAHERDALGREVLTEYCEYLVTHDRRNPRIDAMRDDVVER